ncbi:uncharacterized protein LOC116426361 [Nomia melanderi]|uniref:uncharacterized protein LOC116426361 n=1 Tax=Nomia melanderi TaxID=2448451 RepID=UPI003FCD28A9
MNTFKHSNASQEESVESKIKIKLSSSGLFVDDDGDYTRPRSGIFQRGSQDKRIADYQAGDDLETARWSVGSPLVGFDRTIKHRDVHGTSTPRSVDPKVSLRKTEPESYEEAGRGPDKFDRIGHSDLTKAVYHQAERDAEGTRKLRNIDKDSGSPIAADRREKRDDAPGEGNAGGDREPRGTRGADEEGTAVGKMRKIKRDRNPGWDRKKDRLLNNDIEGNGPDRSPWENQRGGNRSRSRDPGLREVAEDQRSAGEADLTERKKASRNMGNLKSTYMEVGAGGQSLSRSKMRKLEIGDEDQREEAKSSGDHKTLIHGQSNRRKQSLNRQKAQKSKLADNEDYNQSTTETESSRKNKWSKIPNLKMIEKKPANKKGKKVSTAELLREIKNEHIIEDTGNEGKTNGRHSVKKAEERKNYEMEEMVDTSESIGTRERRKKKTDALDSKAKGTPRGFDEEENVPKRDGKRRGRSSRDEADSDLMKKGKGGKVRSASGEDKSTPDSDRRSKKETSEANAKGRRERDSSKANDDYSKINGTRYREIRTKVSDLGETERRHLIEYQLSNQHFVNHGWTLLPIPKITRKVVQYQTKPAKPHLNWFERHKYEGRIYYNDGATIFVNFHPDGTGEVFHPNGRLAIEVYKPGNQKYGMYTVFTPGGKDCVGVERKSQIVGVFDTMGNGAVFDEDGATRLSYNQIGGIWRDNPAGPPLVWKWDVDEKNLVVETVYVEKSAAHIEKFLPPSSKLIKSSGSGKASASPASSRNKEKKVVEQKPVVAVHDSEEEVMSGAPDDYSKDTTQLKTICMKLTDHISLRISNRRNIFLQFFADGKSIRIELGTILNFNKEMTSYFIDTSLKNDLFKCKFDDLLTSHLEPESSLHKLVQELREVKKSSRQRKFMVNKYKPYLSAWKNTFKSRCRP